MGGWLSNMWWGGDPDQVNPVSGLTRREVRAVQKSWAPLARDPLASGKELFVRLFRRHPETKEMFRMVRKLHEEEYTKSPQFKAHVINVIFSLTQAVDNLNQPEIVVSTMNKLGEQHNRFKVHEKHFQLLKGVIVTMFTEVCHMDNATLLAWSKTVDFWCPHIFSTL